MTWQFYVALFIGVAAVMEDLMRRRISNWIPVTALAGGLLCQCLERGWTGALSGLGGAIGGFVVFLVFYLLGGMGGGDVKLMAGLGSVVGFERLPAAALATALCGGVMAVIWLACMAVRNFCVRDPGARVRHIPYAPAIAVGYWLALLSKP
jgi:prepilin peptidase CpaA